MNTLIDQYGDDYYNRNHQSRLQRQADAYKESEDKKDDIIRDYRTV